MTLAHALLLTVVALTGITLGMTLAAVILIDLWREARAERAARTAWEGQLGTCKAAHGCRRARSPRHAGTPNSPRPRR